MSLLKSQIHFALDLMTIVQSFYTIFCTQLGLSLISFSALKICENWQQRYNGFVDRPLHFSTSVRKSDDLDIFIRQHGNSFCAYNLILLSIITLLKAMVAMYFCVI